jgi:hypothetical protein
VILPLSAVLAAITEAMVGLHERVGPDLELELS